MFQDPVLMSRALTALTLGFHVIFATIGVGVPLLILLAEFLGIKKKDPKYTLMARRWSRGYVVTVAVGVVTGTAIGLQLSLLWPNLMRVAGQTIALPLFMETFAFFFEAIFLGIYLYTWDRFKNPWHHMLVGIPVAVGALFSGFFITTVNSFMNQPVGFDIVDGRLANVSPIEAMFSPAMPTKMAHVLTSAILTSAFILAAIAAVQLLRQRRNQLDKLSIEYHKKGLRLTMTVALIFAIATALVGDFSGKYLAKYQPDKLAAAEWHFETSSEAELILGGWLEEDGEGGYEVRGALKIPYALSILAGGVPNYEVTGLDEFAKEDQPPLFIHYLFDAMVGIGMLLALISFLFVLGRYIKRLPQFSKPMLIAIAAGGPLAMMAIEFGWFFAEFGRQPWALYDLMRTSEAATTSANVGWMLIAFAILYAVLGVVTVLVLTRLFKDNPVGKELKQSEHRGEAMFADEV
ncbi:MULTISPECIES: cytochrome ubiquinol oxidase subunit I [Exiguobacterium]|jgi:cytochrome d ubiquinol oxidase subunit I|uniref:Cytochrome D ubiquinol oxidase subunit I n=3 Tax=Exiguobacterium TaxID=33986 RepID=U1N107_9BACL|nr:MULTISPECIES: cytochrome ubiquinol oxidase subunit I [Exiguobacterium]ERG66360.1 cytochrome D ubiquinol oxidase subunit I [Exiguobacterium chiriqhucha RW-2]MDL5375729.1 cytochrome ubiquinol oxidase subunit I [Exiguobacterium mexicanum]UTT41928.1 cytochrome ubiquinol oxidase subunit I [Exiguobacterium aurantiacum]